MKRIVIAMALALAAGAASAQDIRGDWRTAADDNGNSGIVRVEQCGGSYCGTLVTAFDAAGAAMESENVGRRIIWDTNPTTTPGEFRGMIYSPDRDQDYVSRLTLEGNTLIVRGCLSAGWPCREGGRWQRVN
ncbi:DUF2147 domain-containing protein [Rhodobacterales bacterium HKCCE2091]|nr:DUF2147 domain-containing protein [Rhodobacterales bacterium HKCCE2091]